MLRKYAMHFFLLAGVGVTLAIGATFTPVISRSGFFDVPSAEAMRAKQEYAYCRTNLDNVNCACFAGIAGHILAEEVPDFRGDEAMDRFGLARSQAAQSC